MQGAAWDLLEYPETSTSAQLLSALSLFMVFFSTGLFMVEAVCEHEMEESQGKSTFLTVINICDDIAGTFFIIEFTLRLLICPNKRTFLQDKMNLVDLVSILPTLFSFILTGLENMEIIGKATQIMRTIRVMRFLRIFRMVRHFVGLQSLIYTLHKAWKELGLIILIVLITILIFSTLVFSFEQEGSLPDHW